MNTVNLYGRLTNDPELRRTMSGKSVVSFTIAVRRTDEQSDFIRCVAWDKLGELINNSFKKGNRIGVTGNLNSGSYQDANGKNVYTLNVVVEKLDFVETKNEKSTNNHNSYLQQNNLNEYEEEYSDDLDIASDDLPF